MATDLVNRRLTTTTEAGRAYAEGVEALLQLRRGALAHFSRSLALDPTFALAHAALALMGHELCAPVDVEQRVRAALSLRGRANPGRTQPRRGRRRPCPRRPHRGGSAPGRPPRRRGPALGGRPDHRVLGCHPGPAEAWSIVESCTPALGNHWFHAGLLAFVRQEQGRFDEALELADLSLVQMPGSGHAAHARAHVHYETADHAGGLAWLDEWMAGAGAETDNLAHYAWHAAMHELSTGDLGAVERRYQRQLGPDQVSGCRSLVDSGSLLWRWQITPGAGDVPDIVHGTDVPATTLLRPGSAFVGLHAAIALCAADDISGLRSLACWAGDQPDVAMRRVVSPLATALRLLLLDQPSACADELIRIRPDVWRVGGSDAQREVVEETLLTALLRADRYDEARTLIDTRLDRRRCRRDEWFRDVASSGSDKQARSTR